MNALRVLPGLTWLLCLTVVSETHAAEWHVTTNGLPTNAGTAASPWDLESTLQGQRNVRPGDRIWISSGTFRHPDRKHGAMGYAVRLAGAEGKHIEVRPNAGHRVTIDGGLNLQPPTTHLWLRDLEILVSENLSQPRRIDEPGSHPQSYNRPWGGLNIHAGARCKFINLVIHNNAQGVSWWAGAKDSELYGCIIYDNGWDAPDRGHGHAIYTQNKDGLKAISDCIMTGGHSYTLHAYGSSRADVDHYLVTGNICYNAGTFLIGGGKPSHNIRVLTNFLYGVSMRLGYDAPHNEDCDVRGNLIINGKLSINKFKSVIQEGNLELDRSAARPAGTRVVLRANRYDPDRAHLVVFNWERKPIVEVHAGEFLKEGDRFRVLNPWAVFGKPVLEGVCSGHAIALPVGDEFAAFVLIKN